MKTQFFNFLLLVCVLFNISTSTSQNQQKTLFDYGTVNTNLEDRKVDEPLSPYAMFGDNTATITTQHQKNQDYTLKIPIVEDGVEVGLFEMDMQTGIATMKNNDGDLLVRKVLSDEERARFLTIDPMAEKYYSWSPYAYCANNPIRITDPTGMDWFVNNDDGNVIYLKGITKITDEHRAQYNLGKAPFENLGADDMFGSQMDISKIPSMFRDENAEGMVTDQEYLNLSAYSEVFMGKFNYTRAERATFKEIERKSGGAMGAGENKVSVYNEVNQIGEALQTYVRKDLLGQKRMINSELYGNKMNVSSSIIKTYSTTRALGKQHTPYFDGSMRGQALSEGIDALSSILPILKLLKK